MLSAWDETLNRLAVDDPVYSQDDIWRWNPQEFGSLVGLGLVREAEQATAVVCDACCEWHWEEIQWATGGQRAFIPCPEEGAVTVDPERMRQWRIDTGRLAGLLAEALELTGPSQAIELGRVWHLGRRRLGGRFRDLFLATVETNALDGALQAIQRYGGLGSGAVLLPRATEVETAVPAQLRLVDLRSMTAAVDGRISADLDYLEDLFADGRESASSRVRSIPTPSGATWKEASLVVSDALLQVTIRSKQSDRSSAEAGFRDPDQRFDLLKLFAATRGTLDASKIDTLLSGDSPVKLRVLRLRQLLQELIEIDGDPISNNKKARTYTCQFAIRMAGDDGFRTPAGTTWLDFAFHERADGRILVSVLERQRFRARGAEHESGQSTGEVAEVGGTVARTHSLEEMNLRADSGRLTEEGTAFVELLRAGGNLRRHGNDMIVLKLAKRLREWTGLDGEPLRLVEATRFWTAVFACSSEAKQPKN